jgi:Zn-dependent protease with chaperone function
VSRPTPGPGSAGIAARLHDGRTARARAVYLRIVGGRLHLTGDFGAGTWSAPLREVRISERLAAAPRLIELPNGAHLEVADHAALDARLAENGWRDGWVVRWQRHWPAAAAALVMLAVTLWVGYRYLLPVAAEGIASVVSPRLETFIGTQTVRIVDSQLLAPSRLAAARQQAIAARFAAIAPDDGRRYRLQFRGGRLGANALALPGGTIVVTDDLIELAPNDDAVIGVLAHELGHVRGRHFMRRLISATVTGAVATLFLGDASAVLAAIPATLADLGYSREMEREADRYAVALLLDHDIPPQVLADMLERLQAHQAGHDGEKTQATAGGDAGQKRSASRTPPWPEYLSTHPGTAERIEAIRRADAGRGSVRALPPEAP